MLAISKSNQSQTDELFAAQLEAVQELIAISLCLGLFCVMALQLKATFYSLLTTSQFHAITADILFILILVELFVSREVIVNGVLDTDWRQIFDASWFRSVVLSRMVSCGLRM